eukprot:scaffold17773_cov22-Tisochrysis_lutea.AAC.1
MDLHLSYARGSDVQLQIGLADQLPRAPHVPTTDPTLAAVHAIFKQGPHYSVAAAAVQAFSVAVSTTCKHLTFHALGKCLLLVGCTAHVAEELWGEGGDAWESHIGARAQRVSDHCKDEEQQEQMEGNKTANERFTAWLRAPIFVRIAQRHGDC